MEEKTCTHCGLTKPIADFYVRKSGKIYLNCKPCHVEATKLSRLKNVEGTRKTAQLYRENNRDRVRGYARAYLKRKRAECKGDENQVVV